MRKITLGLAVLVSLLCVEALGWTKGELGELDKKCDSGDSEACMDLGWYHSHVYYEGSERHKNIFYYEKVCKKGNEGDKNFLDACYRLGKAYINGPRIQENYKKALELSTMICSRDYRYVDGGGCLEVLELYAKGRGVQKDPDKGAALLKKLCDKGSSIHPCYYAAGYELEKGNKREATKYYEKACERSNGKGYPSSGACDMYDQLK